MQMLNRVMFKAHAQLPAACSATQAEVTRRVQRGTSVQPPDVVPMASC